MGDLVRLCEEELKIEEEEVRKVLPASATLHNCLLLSLNKVAAIIAISRLFFRPILIDF